MEREPDWAWSDRDGVQARARGGEDFEDELFPSSVEPVPEAPGVRMAVEPITIQARSVEVAPVTPAYAVDWQRATAQDGAEPARGDPEVRWAIAGRAWPVISGMVGLLMLGLAAAAALNRAWGGEAGYVAVGAGFLALALLGGLGHALPAPGRSAPLLR